MKRLEVELARTQEQRRTQRAEQEARFRQRTEELAHSRQEQEALEQMEREQRKKKTLPLFEVAEEKYNKQVVAREENEKGAQLQEIRHRRRSMDFDEINQFNKQVMRQNQSRDCGVRTVERGLNTRSGELSSCLELYVKTMR